MDGDTLYLAGSGVTYGGMSCYKRLNIYGPGYFLAENRGSGYNLSTARISTIYFYAGSEGSLLAGCEAESTIFLYAPNITIKRNWIQNNIEISTGAANIIIAQNYLDASSTNSAITSGGADNSDIIVANNLIRCIGSSSYYAIIMSVNDSMTVSNNVIYGRIRAYNAAFSNNIHGDNGAAINNSIELNNSTMVNSIGISENVTLPTTGPNTNNINGEVFADVFGTGTTDGRYVLAETSAAKGHGVGGADAGMFGGANLYVLSGIPPLPTVQLVDGPLFGSQTGGLPVSIKAESNN